MSNKSQKMKNALMVERNHLESSGNGKAADCLTIYLTTASEESLERFHDIVKGAGPWDTPSMNARQSIADGLMEVLEELMTSVPDEQIGPRGKKFILGSYREQLGYLVDPATYSHLDKEAK